MCSCRFTGNANAKSLATERIAHIFAAGVNRGGTGANPQRISVLVKTGSWRSSEPSRATGRENFAAGLLPKAAFQFGENRVISVPKANCGEAGTRALLERTS
jgi:hypothetical protein